MIELMGNVKAGSTEHQAVMVAYLIVYIFTQAIASCPKKLMSLSLNC